jgi:NAD(P)-dependent dehydrogenase (short-subunit alcohol dehydrogenase family)
MPKVILITGCSTGIGAALAEQCHQAGHTVLATARNINNLQHLHPAIQKFALDVTSASSIAQCMQEIRSKVQHIDVLINNAGYGAMGPLLEMPAADVQRQFATNTFAPLHMLQACFDLLQHSTHPRIVNIGSVSGITATPFSGVYCASKAALHTLDDVLRMELFPFGMQVITVQPGAIGSAFGDNAEAQLNKVLPQNSRYAAIKDSIFKRARASQQNPTPAADFAAQILTKILAAECPSLIRAGNGSSTLPLLKRLLPDSLLSKILRQQFGLNRSL